MVVADKAMNTAGNTGLLAGAGDGWIVSASARHADAPTMAWLLDKRSWDDHGGWRVKSKTVTRTVTLPDGTKTQVDEKLVARWSAESAARDFATRAEMLTRAQKMVDDPAVYQASNRRGVKKYVVADDMDPATGEILAGNKQVLSLDAAKAQAEAVMDGYQLLRTSETTMTGQDIINRYRQLWRIEQTFRVSKTDLETRPVFVWTHQRVEGHFATCFLALLTTRLLEQWTRLPAGQLLDALRHLQATDCGQGIYRIRRPDTWDTIDQTTHTPLAQSWATITQLRAWHTTLTKNAKTIPHPTTPENH